MKIEVTQPPRTMMDVFKMLPEGTLAELIENSLYMSPSPIGIHQRTLQKLFRVLSEKVEDTNKGEVFISPYDVYLDEHSNAVQPDIVVVLNHNKNIVNPKGHIHGVPDLLVEILSTGNREYDLEKKKALYERFAVKEYWIVDPETKNAWVFEYSDGRYKTAVEAIGSITSNLLNIAIAF